MEFSGQECCNGLPFPSPGDLPDLGIEPRSSALQADSLPDELQGKPSGKESQSQSHSVLSNSMWPHGLYSSWNSPGQNNGVGSLSLLQGIFPTQELNPDLPYCIDIGSIPGLERSPGEGHGNPLQYSCLENPMDRGAWARVHEVARSWAWLKWFSTHTLCKFILIFKFYYN